MLVCFQEASRNADELLQAEEEEKKKAEKRRMKNKKVNLKLSTYLFPMPFARVRQYLRISKGDYCYCQGNHQEYHVQPQITKIACLSKIVSQ